MKLARVASAVAWISLVCSLGGCQPKAAAPSYADLVTIYNGEVSALDRLENKREKLVKEYETKIATLVAGNLSSLQGILDSASSSLESAGGEQATDPEQLLDQLTANQEAANEAAGNLLSVMQGNVETGELSPELAEKKAQLEKELQEKLAVLDAEIEEQQARVNRARADRDAAQPSAANHRRKIGSELLGICNTKVAIAVA